MIAPRCGHWGAIVTTR